MSNTGKNPEASRVNPQPANPGARSTRSAFPRRPPSEHEGFRSSLIMHNLIIDSHRTTVRLEPVIWDALQDIARQQRGTVNNLVSAINRGRTASGLSSAIRAYVVLHLSARLREALPIHVPQDRQTDPGLRTSGPFYAPGTGE